LTFTHISAAKPSKAQRQTLQKTFTLPKVVIQETEKELNQLVQPHNDELEKNVIRLARNLLDNAEVITRDVREKLFYEVRNEVLLKMDQIRDFMSDRKKRKFTTVYWVKF
jgi:hypothetical protein